MTKDFNTVDQYVQAPQAGVNANIGRALAVSNLASGGAIATAAQMDGYNVFVINQTTAGQTLTMGSPTDTSAAYIIYLVNKGSQSFTFQSVTIGTGKCFMIIWDGDSWGINV